MTYKGVLHGIIVPVLFGVVPAVAIAASDASAAVGCEFNACRFSTGDCDLTELHISCQETPTGCVTYGCQPD